MLCQTLTLAKKSDKLNIHGIHKANTVNSLQFAVSSFYFLFFFWGGGVVGFFLEKLIGTFRY